VTLDLLEGFTVGITADRRWEQQADLLQRRGADVLHGPTMATRYLSDTAGLQAATERVVQGVDYTVLTTGIGVRAWFEAAEAHGSAESLRRAIDRSRILCRGPKAAAALRVAGVRTEPARLSESLGELLKADRLGEMSGRTVAFQHHGAADGTWVSRLEAAQAAVIAVPVYRWELPPSMQAAERLVRGTCAGKVDAVTFTSAPAVANLLRVASDIGMAAPLRAAFNDGTAVAACVGPLCAAGAVEQGIHAPVAPEVGRLGLLVRVVAESLARRTVRWNSGHTEIVLQGRALAVGARSIRLSDTEKALLAALAQKPGAVVAKPLLARRGATTTRGVEACVGRLRRRLEPLDVQLVQTVAMRGYRLAV